MNLESEQIERTKLTSHDNYDFGKWISKQDIMKYNNFFPNTGGVASSSKKVRPNEVLLSDYQTVYFDTATIKFNNISEHIIEVTFFKSENGKKIGETHPIKPNNSFEILASKLGKGFYYYNITDNNNAHINRGKFFIIPTKKN